MSLTNEEMVAKIQSLTDELAALKARSHRRSRSRSKDVNVKTNTNSDVEGSSSEDDLTTILKNYSDALKGLSLHILEKSGNSDSTLTGIMSNISKSRVSRAVSDFSQQRVQSNGTIFGTNSTLLVPNLVPEESKAEAEVLLENLASLKDLFKSALTGVQSEDFASYLQTTSELAEASKLSLSQFYLLLCSRVTPGTPLFTDVSHHRNNKTPVKDLIAELVPLYGEKDDYLLSLQRFENFEIPYNTSPMEVLSQVKALVMDLANSYGIKEGKRDFIFMHVREKMMSLYPNVAPFIIKEETLCNNDLGNFIRLFNSLVPMAIEKSKGKTNEIRVKNPLDVTNQPALTTPLPTIKLTKQHLNRLFGKCFKCGNESIQPPHYAQDCDLYAGKKRAYYLCNICMIGVHLPRDCQQSNTSTHSIMENVQFEEISEEED